MVPLNKEIRKGCSLNRDRSNDPVKLDGVTVHVDPNHLADPGIHPLVNLVDEGGLRSISFHLQFGDRSVCRFTSVEMTR